MAFNFFKKKEVIETNNEDKVNNDIVEDFGTFIKNTNTDNNDLTISSFDINFKEEINDERDLMTNPQPINTTNNISNISNSVDTSFNEEIASNMYTDSNIFPISNNSIPIVENQTLINDWNSNLSDIYNTEINDNIVTNSQVEDNIHNINNYNYNPIMDNLENVQDNIKSSQDVNVVLSNLYKTTEQKDNNTQQDIPTENHDIEHTSIFGETSIQDTFDIDPGYKRCPKCGQKMQEDYKQCFVCGTMFE